MKNLFWISISLLVICCNNPEEIYKKKLSRYIFDTLKVVSTKDSKQYVFILNPKVVCASCVVGAFNKVNELGSSKNITVITNEDINKAYNKFDNLNIVFDVEEKIFQIDKLNRLSSKFMVFQNQEMIFSLNIDGENVKDLEKYF